jgi:hypothetical protein
LWRAQSGGYYQRIATTTADSSGRYSFGGLSNWFYYKVAASKSFGGCAIGYYALYYGEGAELWATGGPRGSNVHMTFSRYVFC